MSLSSGGSVAHEPHGAYMTAEAASTSSAGLMQSSLPQVGHRIMQEIIGDRNINGFWFAARTDQGHIVPRRPFFSSFRRYRSAMASRASSGGYMGPVSTCSLPGRPGRKPMRSPSS